MKTFVKDWLVVVAIVGLVATIAVWLAGCAGAAPSVYGAERLACVERHDTASEARACIEDVDRRWGQGKRVSR